MRSAGDTARNWTASQLEANRGVQRLHTLRPLVTASVKQCVNSHSDEDRYTTTAVTTRSPQLSRLR